MSTVTVIVVNWNGGDWLAECIGKLLRQTLSPTRILLMDNGSTDDSLRKIQPHPNLTIRLLGENLGFAAANNRGIAECDTDYVALLNPDAFPEPDWLERLVEAAERHPAAGSFGSRQLMDKTNDILDGIGDVYHVSGLAWRDGHGRAMTARDLEGGDIFAPCAAAALYRRAALEEAQGFDEDFFCYMEDVDLGFRLRLLGYGCRYVPEAVVHHVGSACTGGRHSAFSVYHGHRNLVWAFVKNMPGILFWLLLPAHLLLTLISLVFIGFRGQGAIILRAKRDALQALPLMWSKRQANQAKRKASVGQIWRLLDKRLSLSRR